MKFIYHMEKLIKENEHKFNRDRKIVVYDVRWDKLTSLLDRLSGYKDILIHFTFSENKNTEVKRIYDKVNKLYNEVSKERTKMLPPIEDLEKDMQKRKEMKKKYNIV